MSAPRVAVCSRSFSKNPVLRAELLARYPDAAFNDAGLSLSDDALVAFLKGAEKAIVGLEVVDDAVLARLPDLRVVSKYGVGLDGIDLAAMRARGRRLGWTAGVNRRSVAELTLGFMLALLHRVPEASAEVRRGTWRQLVGGQLTGRVVGLIGCGHVGKEVVGLLKPFGCQLLAHDLVDYRDFYAAHGVRAVGLDELLARADVVSLHVPLDASTRGLLDAARLAKLKPGAVLVNAARGGLVDENALKALLKDGRLAGAAFDVFASEPPTDAELLGLPNFLATPHIGGSAAEAVLAMGRAAIRGLDENAVPA